MTTSTTKHSVEKFADWDACVAHFEGNVEIAKSMLELLVTELTHSNTQLKAILADRNTDGLRHFSHKLRGGCLYCGVEPLAAHCLAVEKRILENPGIAFDEVAASGRSTIS